MARIGINIKVYRPKNNFVRYLKTMTEEQATKHLKEQEQIAYEDENEFDIWLADNYTQLEIFNMSEEEKQDIDKEWRESCREYVKTLFEDDYREEEIVLSVEEEDLNKYDNFVLAGV